MAAMKLLNFKINRLPRRYFVWATTAVFALFLIGLIFLANQGTETGPLSRIYAVPGGDKVGHFVLMGLLSFLVNLSLRGALVRLGRWYMLKGSLLVAMVVMLEELSQQFIESRTFSLVDLAVDFIGIWLFGRFAPLLIRYWRRP